jgi:hypothetical protein
VDFLEPLVGSSYDFWSRRRKTMWLLGAWSAVVFLAAYLDTAVPVLRELLRARGFWISFIAPFLVGTLLGCELLLVNRRLRKFFSPFPKGCRSRSARSRLPDNAEHPRILPPASRVGRLARFQRMTKPQLRGPNHLPQGPSSL